MIKITFFHRKRIISIILSFLIFSANMIFININPVTAANPTDFIEDVQVGFYLRYEEEITITWNDWNWKDKKVGEAVRRITISEVGEEDFTIREDITYTMNLPTDLDYFYADLETLDGNRQELNGGVRSSIPGNVITNSIHAYYTVELDSGKVLEFKLGGLENEDESDKTSQIPLELEHYWSYLDSTTNTQEYAWDVVGFPYEDNLWGYAVEPEMDNGKKFDDNKWTVQDPITYKFDGQTHDAINITGKWKDETDDEVLAEWESEKICDKDTGLKLAQIWNGECQVQVYDINYGTWSLKEGFQIQVNQNLTDTSFRLQTREHPFSTIKILSPNQGALLGDIIKIRVQVFNEVHDTSINQLTYWAKSSSSQTWNKLTSQYITGVEAPKLWFDEYEIDVSTWTGKWQIKVVGVSTTNFDMFNEYSDIVDVFLKPVYIDNLNIQSLNQYTFGPHTEGGLDRIPYDVNFNLNVREDISGNLQILIDCWYLPLTASFWSEELGETINLEDYWGGDLAYQSIFKAIYTNEYPETDPIIGSQQFIQKEIGDERLVYVDGGNYQNHGYTYTIQNGATQTGSIENNKATTLSLKKGEMASFNFGLFFNNPGGQTNPKIRLYSLEVLVDYEIMREGEKQSFTEKAQKNIAIRTTQPINTPYNQIIQGISEAVSPNNFIGYTIEQTFGEEYAQAAYQGNYVRYLYYLAMGVDTTIRNFPTALSYFGILTGPYWAAVVGTISLATGIPLPTSWLDLITEISARAYAAVPEEDRIGMWYLLLQAAAGVEETNVFDPKPIVEWANVISISGEGELLKTTLRLKTRTYKKSDNQYYLDFNLTNIGDYPARFLTIYIKGDPPNYWTRHEFEQINLDPNDRATQEDIYIGSEDGTYRFDIYFISKPDGISPPVFSLTRGNAFWTPYQDFKIPVISEAITAFSPVDIHIYDQNDNHVGPNSKGEMEIEIPGTWCSGSKTSPETIILSKNDLDTRIEVIGTETGFYKLNFQKPMLLTNLEGEKTIVMTSFTLSNVKISEGEKHTYNYDFDLLEEEINELTINGWSTNEAIQYIFSTIDIDEDKIPDMIDEDPFEKQESDNLITLGIGAGLIIAIVVGAFYFLRIRKPKKSKYKKLDEF